jgi:hypothetical protein
MGVAKRLSFANRRESLLCDNQRLACLFSQVNLDSRCTLIAAPARNQNDYADTMGFVAYF